MGVTGVLRTFNIFISGWCCAYVTYGLMGMASENHELFTLPLNTTPRKGSARQPVHTLLKNNPSWFSAIPPYAISRFNDAPSFNNTTAVTHRTTTNVGQIVVTERTPKSTSRVFMKRSLKAVVESSNSVPPHSQKHTQHTLRSPLTDGTQDRFISLHPLSRSWFNSLPHFSTGFVTSFILTSFTELGDRTFFITVLLVLRLPTHIVFWGSWAALTIQTMFSTLIGYSFHLFPRRISNSKYFLFPLDDYAAGLFLFIFGVHHLLKLQKPNTSSEDDKRMLSKQDTDQVYRQRHHARTSLSDNFYTDASTQYQLMPAPAQQPYADCGVLDERNTYESCSRANTASCTEHFNISTTFLHDLITAPSSTNRPPDVQNNPFFQVPSADKVGDEDLLIEKMVEGLQPEMSTMEALYAFSQVFWVIFVAELADKSMLSTIALATTQNPFAVSLGGSAAHFCVTLIAAFTGSMFDSYISEQLANGLNRQGVVLWPFLSWLNSFQSSLELQTAGSH